MSWELNDEESQAVLSLPGDRRYAYFVERAASRGELWAVLGDGGESWLRMTTADRAFPASQVWVLRGEVVKRRVMSACDPPARCAETKTGVTANRHPA